MLIVSAGFTAVHTSTALATDTEPIAAPSTTKSESSIQLSDYTARYTGKAVAYGGEVERTGSTGATASFTYSNGHGSALIIVTLQAAPKLKQVLHDIVAQGLYIRVF